ncbi:ABC transporter permease [Myroides sp. LoEW2-1]|uniref:ABC transporter permease n=1 Tax=Myroides sp. LoEW2-1 TaxID=2683192 RepID=UPI00293B8926|nr:ABC transporter permease [Myroides sp. LoEW2-1]
MKKGFVSIFKKECIRIFSSPRLLLLMIGIPALLFFFYSSLLSENVARNLPVTLLDLDKSSVSRQLVRMIDANATMDIAYEVTDELEGQRTVRTGKSFALIVIPKDFHKNVQNGLAPNVMCYFNGQYLLPAGLIQRDFQLIAGSFAAGAQIEILKKKGMMPEQTKGVITPIGTDSHTLFNPFLNYGAYLNLGFLPMAFQIVVMIVSIYALGNVLKYKRGHELLEQANNKVFVAIVGKLLPYTIVFFIVGFFMNSLLFYKIQAPLNGSFAFINLITLSFIIVCQSMALFVTSVVTSLRTAMTIGGGYTALAFSFTGYTFPPEGMSNFVQGLNYIFPFHSYLRFVISYAVRGISFNGMQRTYLIVLSVFVVIGIISAPIYYLRLKKGGYNV